MKLTKAFRRRSKHIALALLSIKACLLFGSEQSSAQSIWKNGAPGDGLYSDAANWPSGIPGPTENIAFHNNANVSFDSDAASQNLVVRGGNINFNLANFSFDIDRTLAVATEIVALTEGQVGPASGDRFLEIDGGMTSAQDVSIISGLGFFGGGLTLNNAAQLKVEEDLDVGRSNTARLEVLDRSELRAGRSVAGSITTPDSDVQVNVFVGSESFTYIKESVEVFADADVKVESNSSATFQVGGKEIESRDDSRKDQGIITISSSHSDGASVTPAGTLSLQGGTLRADIVELISTPNGPSDARLEGAGVIAGPDPDPPNHNTQVENAGVINVTGSYSSKPDGFRRFAGPPKQAQLWIQGSYSQTGSFMLGVDDSNRPDQLGRFTQVPVVIEDDAQFGGSLTVDYTGSTPQIGDRFAIALAKDITGRFDTFVGSDFDPSGDLFFALDYVKNTDTSASPTERIDHSLELVAIEKPITKNAVGQFAHLRQPTSNKLVLIAPGTADSFQGSGDEFFNLMSEIEARAPGWDVAYLNWTGVDPNNMQTEPLNGSGPLDAWSAAANGIDVGESVFHWLKDSGVAYDDGVHLFGHSAGVWLADALADKINGNNSATPVHLTLFDAFTPQAQKIEKIGDDGPLMIGETADFADHFVDRSGRIISYVPFTDEILSNFVNVDVTNVRPPIGQLNRNTPNCVVQTFCEPHFWPVFWYDSRFPEPVIDPNNDERILGFANSLEYREQFGLPFLLNHEGIFRRGEHLVVRSDGIFRTGGTNEVPIIWANQNNIKSETGSIEVDANSGAILSTGSPAILTSMVDLPSAVNALSFELEFRSAATGLLSVYLDAEIVFQLDNQLFSEVQSVIAIDDLMFDKTLESGLHTVMLRFDPLDELQASIRVSNPTFKFIELIRVPEPSSAMLMYLALATAITLRRTRPLR